MSRHIERLTPEILENLLEERAVLTPTDSRKHPFLFIELKDHYSELFLQGIQFLDHEAQKTYFSHKDNRSFITISNHLTGPWHQDKFYARGNTYTTQETSTKIRSYLEEIGYEFQD